MVFALVAGVVLLAISFSRKGRGVVERLIVSGLAFRRFAKSTTYIPVCPLVTGFDWLSDLAFLEIILLSAHRACGSACA